MLQSVLQNISRIPLGICTGAGVLFQESFVPRFIQVDSANQRYRQSWLGARLTTRVTIVWTDNRSSMLSVRGDGPAGLCLRLHYMFHQAPDAIWHALVAYIRDTDVTARDTLRTYVQCHQHLIRRPPEWQRRSRILQPRGDYFDLEVIYRELNQSYFADRVQVQITWSRWPPKRPRTSIRFGSYHAKDRLIRVHRLLDQSFVPRYVIENVVFHEMLHQLIPRRRVNGRWRVHPPEFRQQERRFPYHRQAEQWEHRHLVRLLRG